MRNRLTEVFEVHFGWAVEGIRFNWSGTAVVAGGDALENQLHDFFRLFRAFQPSVDGVGEANGLAGRNIAFFGGLIVFRQLL